GDRRRDPGRVRRRGTGGRDPPRRLPRRGRPHPHPGRKRRLRLPIRERGLRDHRRPRSRGFRPRPRGRRRGGRGRPLPARGRDRRPPRREGSRYGQGRSGAGGRFL
ncbi:MAG: Hemolysins and related proteins containing CBS domains, partial [uncultured Rubrobacteraceae bacterium]